MHDNGSIGHEGSLGTALHAHFQDEEAAPQPPRPRPLVRVSTAHRIRSPWATMQHRSMERLRTATSDSARNSRSIALDATEATRSGRIIPLYLLCLDLIFAAAFSTAAQWLDQGGMESIVKFFMLYLAVGWQWDHLNRLFNRFDTEDLISELVVVVSMGCVMVVALNTRECFFPAAPALGAQATRCIYSTAAYMSHRLLLSIFTAYISLHVKAARVLLWREGALWLMLLPPLVIFFKGLLDADPAMQSLGLLFGSTLLELALCLVDLLPWNRCTRAMDLGLPLDASYTIARYDRIVIVAIGSVCVDAVRLSVTRLRSFGWRSAALGAATPWYVFLMKVYYFDLSNYNGSDCGEHATGVSRQRALVWSLLHLPLLGCLLWTAASLAALISGETGEIGRPFWELCAAFAAYVVICSLQQCTHADPGCGKRRCGRVARLWLRVGGIAVLCAAQGAFAMLRRVPNASVLPAAVVVGDTVYLTLLAACELWGRNIRDVDYSPQC